MNMLCKYTYANSNGNLILETTTYPHYFNIDTILQQ